MKTMREKALEHDIENIAQDLKGLRDYMGEHLNADTGVLPNAFWKEVDEKLAVAQLKTDIVAYFPDKPLVTYLPDERALSKTQPIDD